MGADNTDALQHNQEQAIRGISLCGNLDKTEFLCFKWDGIISSLNGKNLKLVDHFT